MKALQLTLGLTTAIAILVGCAAPAGNVGSAQPPVQASRESSALGKNHALLYVGYGLGGVVMYDYATFAQVGQLSGFEGANGMCVDTAQNVYVTDYNKKKVFKYAHGAEEPEQTLDDSSGFGIGCAVNLRNGDLAVANQTLVSQECGDIVIYRGGSGTPTSYTTGSVCEDYNPAYNNAGDLFVAGTTNSGYGMAELPKGKKSFINMTFDHPPASPAGLQWDGAYLDVGSDVFEGTKESQVIYRFTVSGQNATLHQTVALAGMDGMYDFFLVKGGPGIKRPLPHRLVAAGSCCGSTPAVIAAYRFPNGGSPRRMFKYQIFPSSIVVSEDTP